VLDRSAEAIDIYDDLLARFDTATELPMRSQVANALFNKGVTLDALGRRAEAIDVYDDLLSRFGSATELPLREPVVKAESFKDSVRKS
jgi:tetratricopeptide (TPR) repeat protein